MSETELQKMPVNLIELALEKGAGVDQLEKLMEMQSRWEQKEASKEFKRAFTEFQAMKPELKKTESVMYGGKLQFKFNSLAAIQKAVDPVLSKFGLSYRWEQQEVDNRIEITCILSHISGHSEYTSLSAPLDTSGSKNAIQSIGSTVSYLKRYTLEGACGLSSDKDTDAAPPAELPELLPTSGRWPQAVKAVKAGKIATVKAQYKLSEENEALILKEAGL